MPATDRTAGLATAGPLTTGPSTTGPSTTGLQQVIGEAVASGGFVLEGVTISPAGRRSVVRVVVDVAGEAPGGVDLDQVAVVTRLVSAALETPTGEAALQRALGASPYVLEVSSPGVDRPLTQRRHWQRARGRLASVTPAGEGAEVAGRVERVDDEGVLLGGTLLAWSVLDGAAGRVHVEFTRDGVPDDDADLDVLDDTDDDDDDTDEEA